VPVVFIRLRSRQIPAEAVVDVGSLLITFLRCPSGDRGRGKETGLRGGDAEEEDQGERAGN